MLNHYPASAHFLLTCKPISSVGGGRLFGALSLDLRALGLLAASARGLLGRWRQEIALDEELEEERKVTRVHDDAPLEVLAVHGAVHARVDVVRRQRAHGNADHHLHKVMRSVWIQ